MQEHRPAPLPGQGQRPMGSGQAPHGTPHGTPHGAPHGMQQGVSAGGPSRPPARNAGIDLDPIELIDDDSVEVVPGAPAGAPPGAGVPQVPQGPSKIRQFATSIGNVAHQENFKRKTNVSGQGAIRIRTFHGRLSDEGLIYMDSKINEWLDAHPDIEVKFVTTTVGLYEAKIKEQALIVNVWY